MVRPERGLLRLLAKLGIKSAETAYMRISILRGFKAPNPWYIKDDEPDILAAGILVKEDK